MEKSVYLAHLILPAMPVTDLKTIMHRRIDQLTDDETVVDLFETMNSFLEGRSSSFDSDAPEVVARLQRALTNVEVDQQGISTDELITKMQQWRTR